LYLNAGNQYVADMKSNLIYVKYGVLIAIALIVYFLIVRLIGLHENHWLRLLNGVIVAYGIYAVIRKKKALENDKFEYFSGFATGIGAGILATAIFVFFMGIYLFHIDPTFAENIMAKWMTSYNGGPEILLFILAIEGVSSSVVLSLTFMQKFKISRNMSDKTFSV